MTTGGTKLFVPQQVPEKKLQTATNKQLNFTKKTAFVVPGMHRSGTSAFTRVFNLLGCDLPRTLMPANIGNESGYWESLVIADFNDVLLDSAGSKWNDWLPVNPGWYRSPKAGEFKERALELLQEEFGESHMFVLKDPRICRILPFWLDVLESSEVQPAIVIPVRNPLEVAASLEKRDGIDPGLSYLIWLRNVLEAEIASRGRIRFFCSYEAFMNSWPLMISKAQETLGINFPRLSERTAGEIDSFLADDLRHHKESPDRVVNNPLLFAWMRNAYEIFNRWAESDESSVDFAVLDRIRAEFDAAAPAFTRLVDSGLRAADRAKTLEQQFTETRSRLETELFAAQQQAQLKDSTVAGLTRKTRLLESELTAAQQQVIDREAVLAEKNAEVQQIMNRLSESQIKTEQISGLLNEQRERTVLLEQELNTRNKNTAGQLAKIQEESNRLEAALEIERRQLAALKDESARERELLQAELIKARTERDEIKNRLAERFGEITTLSRLVRDAENETLLVKDRLEWLRRVAIFFYSGGWRRRLVMLLPNKIRRALVAKSLRFRRLFDATAYLNTHRDVAEAGVDPLAHYLNHGIFEGRSLGPGISVNQLDTNQK